MHHTLNKIHLFDLPLPLYSSSSWSSSASRSSAIPFSKSLSWISAVVCLTFPNVLSPAAGPTTKTSRKPVPHIPPQVYYLFTTSPPGVLPVLPASYLFIRYLSCSCPAPYATPIPTIFKVGHLPEFIEMTMLHLFKRDSCFYACPFVCDIARLKFHHFIEVITTIYPLH